MFEIGNQRLTLNLYSSVAMHFQDSFKFCELCIKYQESLKPLVGGLRIV